MALMEIGNATGKFIYVDPACMGARDKIISWILVDIHLSGGLPAEMHIHWELAPPHIVPRVLECVVPVSDLSSDKSPGRDLQLATGAKLGRQAGRGEPSDWKARR